MTVAKRISHALRTVLEGHASEVHTALPGIVTAYYPDRQTVDVQPALNRVIPAVDEDLEDETESLPLLRDVPVAWPRSGGHFMHFPMAEGDSVLLVFSEADTTAWRRSGEVSDPDTAERHGINGAVAIPGYFPRNDASSAADGTNGRIGRESGPYVEFKNAQIDVGGDKALAEAAALDDLRQAVVNGFSAIGAGAAANGELGKAAFELHLSTAAAWAERATTVTKGD